MVKKIEGPDASGTASPPAAHPAQVESMDALIREGAGMQANENADADRTNQAHEQAQDGQRQAQAASAVSEIVQVLRVARNMGANLAQAMDVLPKDKVLEIWSDEQLTDLAGPLLAVCERHGDQVSAFLAQYGPYVMLIGATAMPAIATVKAIRAHKPITVKAQVVPAGEGVTGG